MHSSVANLFNLEYISTSMLWIASIFPLPHQFTTSRFISSHTWRSCTPQHGMIATAVISTLMFKPFSIFFYPVNCSFSIFFFFFLPCSLCPTLQFIPGKLHFWSAASLCQMLCQCKQHRHQDTTKDGTYGTNTLPLFSAEQLALQVSRDGCTNPLCSIQMTSKE